MSGQVCAIIGYGPGLGTAYAKTFSDAGYELALLSRSGAEFDPDGGTAKSYVTDAGDPETLQSTLAQAENELGPIDVLIYNADLAMFGTVDDLDEQSFEQSWRVSVLGFYAAARTVGRAMAERGSGAIVVSGATASLRGKPWTTAFAAAKAAQRSLAQSLARTFGPSGVHVAYLIIDGVIDTEDTRTNFAPDAPDDFFMDPKEIAGTALQLVRQDRSAWTFEIDLRPFREEW